MNQPRNMNDPELDSRLTRLESLVSGTDGGNSEIDLRELFAVIWRGKWLIAAVAVLFAGLSIAYALWLPNQYTASAILTPASTSSTSALSQLASQFGGVAALAGVNLGGGNSDDKSLIAMELVKSWGFLEDFIRSNQIETEVFAAKGWNRATNQLEIDPRLYDVKQKKWMRDFNASQGQTVEPSGWELYDAFSDRVAISQDKKTGLVTLSVEYYSPELAKQWVDKLIVAINRHLQEQDRQEASNSIEYLRKQINQTSLSEMQTVFYKLIEEQTKNLMLAEVSDEYVLKTLSPAKVPEKKSQPKRAIIVVLATMLGGMLAIFWVLARNAYATQSRNSERKHEV